MADDAGRSAVNWPRLVPEPVFLFCAPRSGSTLLRCVLDSHSEIHAPHEMHLTRITVDAGDRYVRASLAESGLGAADLEHMLWDRMLHSVLLASGKRLLVEKTPPNVLSWRRITACWPRARYIFLARHPAHITRSNARAMGPRPCVDPVRNTLRYVAAIEEARQALGGHRLRYEDLTAAPADVVKDLCRYLGVAWEPGMLDYGRAGHGSYARRIGDWSDRIRSGRIQPAPPPPRPQDVPAPLRECAAAWGYL